MGWAHENWKSALYLRSWMGLSRKFALLALSHEQEAIAFWHVFTKLN
jgi:hypothetical protein